MVSAWRVLRLLALVAGTAASCSSGTPGTTATTGRHAATVPSTTPPVTEPLAAHVAVEPDHVFAGTEVTFTVTIRGAGLLEGEGVRFGDGGTSGANAGDARCGDTARADHVSTYAHAYDAPGTYTFRDDVTVTGPPPTCTPERATATVTVPVASTLPGAGGAVLSPTGNIACGIYFGATADRQEVHCATFSPPRTADMTPTGDVATCSGSTCTVGNPAPDTPVLAYGAATGVGPFLCASRTSGMTCTVPGGRGFTISRAGITLLGG